MCSYPSSMQVSDRCLIVLSDAFRQRPSTLRTRLRRVAPGQQALLVVAHLPSPWPPRSTSPNGGRRRGPAAAPCLCQASRRPPFRAGSP